MNFLRVIIYTLSGLISLAIGAGLLYLIWWLMPWSAFALLGSGGLFLCFILGQEILDPSPYDN